MKFHFLKSSVCLMSLFPMVCFKQHHSRLCFCHIRPGHVIMLNFIGGPFLMFIFILVLMNAAYSALVVNYNIIDMMMIIFFKHDVSGHRTLCRTIYPSLLVSRETKTYTCFFRLYLIGLPILKGMYLYYSDYLPSKMYEIIRNFRAFIIFKNSNDGI
jgi:hypothetical protein